MQIISTCGWSSYVDFLYYDGRVKFKCFRAARIQTEYAKGVSFLSMQLDSPCYYGLSGPIKAWHDLSVHLYPTLSFYRRRKHRSAFIRARFASGAVESPGRVCFSSLWIPNNPWRKWIVSSHLARVFSFIIRYPVLTFWIEWNSSNSCKTVTREIIVTLLFFVHSHIYLRSNWSVNYSHYIFD